MNATEYKRGIIRVLQKNGFYKTGKSLRRDQEGVSSLISFEKGFGNQWYIVVGFWIHALGELATERVEKTHYYARLERLMPLLRETIISAGDLDDPHQPGAYGRFIQLFSNEASLFISALGSDEGLRNAAKKGNLNNGLLRKEARQYLECE